MERREVLASIAAANVAMLAPAGALRAATDAPARHRVVITDFEFVPSVLTVRVGHQVTWVNMDIAPHTATATDESWDAAQLNTNKDRSIEIEAGMATDYFCQFPPSMKAKLRIVAG